MDNSESTLLASHLPDPLWEDHTLRGRDPVLERKTALSFLAGLACTGEQLLVGSVTGQEKNDFTPMYTLPYSPATSSGDLI